MTRKSDEERDLVQQMRALTSRQQQREARIFTCTRDLLAEAGYEGLQIRTLAERAGVAPMTLYNRYGNKSDIALLALQELLAELAQTAQASGKEGIEFVLHNARIFAQQILNTPRYAQAMAMMLFNSAPHSPIADALLDSNIRANRERISEMQQLGEIEFVSPSSSLRTRAADRLARHLSTCTWSTILLWMKGAIADDDFLDEYCRASLLTIAPFFSERAAKRYDDLLI